MSQLPTNIDFPLGGPDLYFALGDARNAYGDEM